MIEALISSKTRIKLLLKFFLNGSTSSYLRSLASEFDESTNSIRVELNRLEGAGLLESFMDGNKKMYHANDQHPLFAEIHNIVIKHFGIDHILDKIIHRLGNVEKVYLTGDFARGRDSQIIDLLIVGDIDHKYLIELIERAEGIVNRKVRYLTLQEDECDQFLHKEKRGGKPLLLWAKEPY